MQLKVEFQIATLGIDVTMRKPVMLGLGLRPENVGLGLEGYGLGLGLGGCGLGLGVMALALTAS